MNIRLLPLALAAAIAAGAPASAAAANLLTNGSFEATSLASGSWVNVPSIAGWTWTAGPGTGFEVRNNAAGSAIDGNNFIELDTTGNSSIAQTVAGLVAGTQYNLDFWYSPRIGQPASTNGIQVFWNGNALGGVLTADGGSSNVWTAHHFSVLAASGSNVLSFSAVGISDSLGGNLDGVSLTAAVPEPGSAALSVAGLVALVALRRRQRR